MSKRLYQLNYLNLFRVYSTVFFFSLLFFQSYANNHKLSFNDSAFTEQVAKETAEHIVKYTGLSQNFQIVADKDIPTAIAYIRGKKRYVAYNPDFILRVKDKTQTDWGAISVLAHEIGHHLSGHTLKRRQRNLTDELEADRFSGFILYKMGASLEETQAAINKVELKINPTHPSKEERLKAITNGWLDAKKLER